MYRPVFDRKMFSFRKHEVVNLKFKITYMKRIIFAALIAILCAACTNEEVDNGLVPKPSLTDTLHAVVKTDLEHELEYDQLFAQDEMTSTTTIYMVDADGYEVDSFHFLFNPRMEVKMEVMKDNYTITEDLIESEVISYNLTKGISVDGDMTIYSDTALFRFNDGQEVKIPTMITAYQASYGVNEYECATLELTNVELVGVYNEDAPATRSSYVSQRLLTKYVVDLTYSEKNVSKKDEDLVITLMGQANRNVLSEDEIADVRVENKKREVISATEELCSFDYVIIMKSGDEVRSAKSITLNRNFTAIDTREMYVSDFAYALENVDGITEGVEASVEAIDGWAVYGRTDVYGASINNEANEDFETVYNLYHQRAVYRDAYVEVDFGYEAINVTEVGTTVKTVATDKNGYDKAEVLNKIETSYIGFGQELNELVYIYKTALMISGYEFRNGNLVVNNNNVVATVDFVSRYNDGSETVETLSKSFARSLICTSEWSSKELSSNQTTGNLITNITNTNQQNVDGWNWNVVTRSISTTAELQNSSKENTWTSVEVENISVSKNGKTFTFDALDYSITADEGRVELMEDGDVFAIYTYNNTISVNVAENTLNSTALGSITVEKEVKGDFPVEWGRFVGATSTLSVNEEDNDWVYAWSIHFEKGTLPVIVRKSGNEAEVNQSQFEYDTNPKFNGAAYKNGVWRNAIASDEANYMLWADTNCAALDALIYSTATMWKWNNGNNTVFNNDFTFSIENDGMVLVVKKNGVEFARYRASNK